jgi:hypothetical protein
LYSITGSEVAVLKAIACSLAVFCIAGCGKSVAPPDPSVVVTGVVTMDGKPLPKATVRFIPQDGANQGFGGSGVTDSAGKYELRSLAGNEAAVGTPPGKYKVIITRMVKPDGTVADMMEPPMMSAARESIPLRYSDTASSVLGETVSSTGGTFDFALTSE